MKITPLQASNLKQEDNLRPKKKCTTQRTIQQNERAACSGFSSDNRVVGPGEFRAPRPGPSNERNDDTQPGNTPTRLSLKRSGF
jgi:hypothetical protein